MNTYANTIIKGNGEGVMLRRPGSLYDRGKSRNIVKYKVPAVPLNYQFGLLTTIFCSGDGGC